MIRWSAATRLPFKGSTVLTKIGIFIITATKVEQVVFAVTSKRITDLFHDFEVFMEAGEGLDAIVYYIDFEFYIDKMMDEMSDDIEEFKKSTGLDYSYYSRVMDEDILVNSYISAKTRKDIHSNIRSVGFKFEEFKVKHVDDYP